MKHFFSLIVILLVLVLLAAAKVLLRTNFELAVGIIIGSGLILFICWYLYPKFVN